MGAQEVTKSRVKSPPSDLSAALLLTEATENSPQESTKANHESDSLVKPSSNGSAQAKEKSVSKQASPEQPVHRRDESQSLNDGLLLTIKTLGNLLDDLERVRIMNANRIDALKRDFDASLPALDMVQSHLAAVEHEAVLEIQRVWRKHPLRKWVADYPGVGEKLIARLIAEIGDPGERPNVAKLWAYCGVGDPARKRSKGMTQEEALKLGNPKAKKICWLIGESFVKVNRGPGREAYDAAREKYADRVHEKACVRCGPAGKPALPGSPWSLKHQHEAAKRYAVKMFLKDLWVASRQGTIEIPYRNARGEN